DLNCRNQDRRRHYLCEPGWRADAAIQGLGRSHRTNQASAPLFCPVTTDIHGEKRFTSTISRRLDSLGALTKGERRTAGNGL
ncbi:MAG TPA: strawberry notch C-terminal domain-containing protein, partial [Caulobacter sp.]|nr:strawberry notch C-terminal domain-containing protein [Caulobacter sp.]